MKELYIYICGALLIATLYLMPHFNRDTIKVTVKKSERVTTGSGENISNKYLIFTDKGVFENTDSFVEFKFNSSDLYSEIEEGKSYNFKVYGWRIPFFSMYKNVVKIVE